jgi:hypothetical protein
MPRAVFAAAFVVLAAGGALAADTSSAPFVDGPKDTKVHAASRFVCPLKIGEFERDAAGETDPQSGTDFCAYSARDGVYGTITLKPLNGAYDAKTSFADAFSIQEGTGGKLVSEDVVKLAPLEIFTRSYETSHLADLHYRVLYAGTSVGNWAVEATIEYVEPRDNADQRDFLKAVYRGASAEIAAGSAPSPSTGPRLAPDPAPR